MAKEARQRETLNSRVVYNFHPMFQSSPPTFLYGNDSAVHVPATVEGGDVAVVGHRTVMVGMGERTTPQGIELLSQRLFETGTAERVIVVELPKLRAFMHLDTALTQIDRDAYSVYPYLPEELRSWTVTPQRGGLAFHENDDLFRELSYALQVDRVRVLKVPMDRRAAEREQWDDGNNFLAARAGRRPRLRVQHHHEPLPRAARHHRGPRRGLRARPRPRRPALHDLPHLTRGLTP